VKVDESCSLPASTRLHYYEHLRFFEAATRGAPVEVTAEDGLRAVEIGAAAELSARERRPIELGGKT
jgi:predicted dehydrogenase